MTYMPISIADIHHFQGQNFSRHYTGVFGFFKDDKDFANLASQLSYGWKPNIPLTAYELTPAEVEIALAERLKVWQALRASDKSWKVKVKGDEDITVIGRDALAAFEAYYTGGIAKPKKTTDVTWMLESSDGQWRVLMAPKYGAVDGFRRSSTFNVVNAALVRVGDVAITEIPCMVKVFECELDKMAACIEENTHRDLGVRKLGQADKIVAALGLFHKLSSEAQMGRILAMKRGQAQKFHAMCWLINKYPELKLLDKMLANPENIAKADKEKLRLLKGTKELKYEDGGTPAEVLAYFLAPVPGGNDKKMASKTEIEKLSEQSAIQISKEIADAILKDDLGKLHKYNDKAALINAAIEAIMSGVDFAIKGGEIVNV